MLSRRCFCFSFFLSAKLVLLFHYPIFLHINVVTSTHGQNYGSGQAGQQYATALCHSYVDSPATTSATVYAFYMRSNGGGTVGYNNYGSTGNNTSASTIIIQEIAQ